MTDLIEELEWRGLIQQHTDLDELRKAFAEGPITYYCGFDPTAPSLHHGHLVQLVLMRHLQLAGNKPLALVGGATGLIGDPRDVGERSLNSTEVVEEWASRLRGQIESFLDFDGDNPAQMVNNLEWIGSMSAIDLLREIGKYFRVGTMLSKDVVARRLASDEGISYTEFSYQVLQGTDYLELFRRRGCTLQTGGNDQWGNLVAGADLIRKVEGKSVHLLTTPIVTKADGTKFGKTSGGAIWLDPKMMSPYDFYQFWLRTDDADVVKMLKIFTFLDRRTIGELEVSSLERPHLREAQKALAAQVTKMVHGEDAYEQVVLASQALWGSGDLRSVDGSTLRAAAAHLPSATVELGQSTVVDAMLDSGLERGRQAALRTVKQGGVYLNNEKVQDPDRVIAETDLLPGGFALLRKGKKTLAALNPSQPQ